MTESQLDLPPLQGAQIGSFNDQRNFFAPVTYNFSGKFERLRDACFDPTLLERDLDLKRFTGREWLIGRVDDFIRQERRGYIFIRAEAGVGKSALAAYLVRERGWLHHFTRLPGGRSPSSARKSLAVQLIRRWNLLDEFAPGGVLPGAASEPGWFDRLLGAAAAKRNEAARDRSLPPIVLVVDGLDETDPEPSSPDGLPLGLPASLPDGVFVVATSRFGMDSAVTAARDNPAWEEIRVDGPDNLTDMDRFLEKILTPGSPIEDRELLSRLNQAGVDRDGFRQTLTRSCQGVWIYLYYVLEEIRRGKQTPGTVGMLLPKSLGAYYAEHVNRWRGSRGDAAADERWERTRGPLLGVLTAARAPLTARELARFAGVESDEATRLFVEETARAFLTRAEDEYGAPAYALRHQSLRDMLAGLVQAHPGVEMTAGMVAPYIMAAHKSITKALTPVGATGARDWKNSGTYARANLAVHAAACGRLDDLVCDPGFLLVAEPMGVLAQRAGLRTTEGRSALAAYGFAFDRWDAPDTGRRLFWLETGAARLRAGVLAAACARLPGNDWPISWAAWNGYAHRTLADHESHVDAIAIGRAGSRDVIVAGTSTHSPFISGAVKVWDVVTGEQVGEFLHDGDSPIGSVAIGKVGDREIIASGSKLFHRSEAVYVWDAVTGERIGKLLGGHKGAARLVAIGKAGDREIIVSGISSFDGSGGAVHVWDAVTGEQVGKLLASDAIYVHAVAIGKAGDRDIIVSGTSMSRYSGAIFVWDAATGEPVGRQLVDHGYPVWSVAIGRACGRDIIVSGSESILIWDAITGKQIHEPLAADKGPCSAVAIGKVGDRDIIVSGHGADEYPGNVFLWDVATGKQIGTRLGIHEGIVGAVAIGRAGDREIIASSSGEFSGKGVYSGSVRIWDATVGGQLRKPLEGHENAVLSVAIGRAGDRDIIVSGSYTGFAPYCEDVRIWDAVTGEQIGKPLGGHEGAVNSVAIGKAGDRDIIVSGAGWFGEYGAVHVWDAVTGEQIGNPLTDHNRPVWSVAIGRAGNQDIIVSGTKSGSIHVWDAITGKQIYEPLATDEGSHPAVAIGRIGDRDIIVSGPSGEPATVRVWDAVTGKKIGKLHGGQEGTVCSVAVGRAGGRDIIVSSTDSGSMHVWDAITGRQVRRMSSHDNDPVNAVAIGRTNGQDVIVSSSCAGSIYIWDVITGEQAENPLDSHEGPVIAVAIGKANGRDIIVSGSSDCSVLVRSRRPSSTPFRWPHEA